MRKRETIRQIPAPAAIETVLNIISMIVSLLDAIFTLITKIFTGVTA